MVIPWIKLALVSLNVGTSATLGGLVSYGLFAGSTKEPDGKDAEAIRFELEKAEKEFREENERANEQTEAKKRDLEGKIAALKKVESCLWRMQESYERTIKDLGWWRIFKRVTYSGEYCNDAST